MNTPLKTTHPETTDEFIDRAIQTRGKIEQAFWAQASQLKALFASVRPHGFLQELIYEQAKERAEKANTEYLNDDVESAVKLQRKALQALQDLSS